MLSLRMQTYAVCCLVIARPDTLIAAQELEKRLQAAEGPGESETDAHTQHSLEEALEHEIMAHNATRERCAPSEFAAICAVIWLGADYFGFNVKLINFKTRKSLQMPCSACWSCCKRM